MEPLATTTPESRSTRDVPTSDQQLEDLQPTRIFPYGVSRERLERAARRMHVPIRVVKDIGQAETLLTTKAFYRKRPRLVLDAERRGLPIYVLRANTVAQMEAGLGDLFDLEHRSTDRLAVGLREMERAIQTVLGGAREVELSPQNAYVRRRQHELARAPRTYRPTRLDRVPTGAYVSARSDYPPCSSRSRGPRAAARPP